MNKEKKVLRQLLSQYHIERSHDNKWWWIIQEPNRLVCEVYTKKHAEQIFRLLSFDKQTLRGERS